MKNEQILSEETLIKMLQANDSKAFDLLYWKYQKAIFQNAMKLTHSETMSEDIVQEVFISLWEHRRSLDAQRGVGGWLFVTCYNRIINYSKQRLRQIALLNEINFTSEISTSETIFSEDNFNQLEKAIQTLSPQKKQTLLLCKLQGLTYEEAANQMGISKFTIKEYLSQAISDLKKLLKK